MKNLTTIVSACAFVLILGLVPLGSVMAQTVGSIGIGDITIDASVDEPLKSRADTIEAIESGLNNALIKTRKFTVLNHDQLTDRLRKQGRSLASYYDKSYSGTEYSQAGLDYILTANVTELGVFTKKRSKSENVIGLLDIDFRLIGVADVTSDISSGVSAQVSKRVVTGDENQVDEVLDEVVAQAVNQLVDQVIAGLFPVRVMQIADNGEIKLNYGAGLLSPGDTVLVFPKGQDVVVDESGEVIAESIATLQIVSVEKKFAAAQALTGFSNIEKGQQGHVLLTDG